MWQSHNGTFNNRGHRYSRCMWMCARAYEDKPRAPEVMLINGPVEGNCTPIFSLLLQFSLPVLLSLALPYTNSPHTNLNRAARFSSTKNNGVLRKTSANCRRIFSPYVLALKILDLVSFHIYAMRSFWKFASKIKM